MNEYERNRGGMAEDFRTIMAEIGLSAAPPVKKRPKTRVKPVVHEPTRQSLRLISRSLGEDEKAKLQESLGLATSEAAPVYEEVYQRPSGPLTLSECFNTKLVEDVDIQDSIDKFQSFKAELQAATSGASLNRWDGSGGSLVSQVKQLNCRERWKVTTSRIYSVCFHQSECKLLVAAGDKLGDVGLLDWTQAIHDDSKAVVWQFRPHSRPVNCVKFNRLGDELFSCSYDGSIRRFHLNKGVFDEVYADEEDVLKCLAFFGEKELLVSSHFGNVIHIDLRKSKHDSFDSKQGRLRTVDVHPSKPQYFCTAAYNGQASVWDWRSTKRPLCSMAHGHAVNSAFFSARGSYVLTSSMSDRITVWNVEDGGKRATRHAEVVHDNHVGRWLTNIRPVWHPTSEEIFLTGCMKRPRILEVFHSDGRLAINLQGLSTVCSITAWHPTLALLCGGNSSGYVTFFC